MRLFDDPRLQAFITVALGVFVILNQIGIVIMSANKYLGTRTVYIKKESLLIDDTNSNLITHDGTKIVPIEANTSTNLDRFYFVFSLVLITLIFGVFVYYVYKGSAPKNQRLAAVYSHMEQVRKKSGF